MFGWNDKPTRAVVKYTLGGDNPGRVVTVGYGQFEVTIPDDPDADVTYKKPYGATGDPRQTFPNMEVRDGAMQIPLEDIVSSILDRVEPTEIAVALWADDAVREQFVEAMVTRYSEMNVGDADRRKFLRGVKEAVHSKALDHFANAASKLEYDFGRKWFFYHEINRVNDWLRAGGYTDANGEPIQLKQEDEDGAFKIGGANWNEARNHWRDEALRIFPAQVDRSPKGGNGEGGAVEDESAARQGAPNPREV